MRNATLAWIALACAAVAPAAFAHAELETAEPKVGSVITAAPAEVVLRFSERIEAAFSGARVLDAAGREVDLGRASVDEESPNVLHVPVGKLAPGTYKVEWRVISVDTHKTQGDFTFEVTP